VKGEGNNDRKIKAGHRELKTEKEGKGDEISPQYVGRVFSKYSH